MEHVVTSWLAQFGAPALFALLTLGVFGLPIPDETILVLAGLLVSQGRLRAASTVAAAAGGAMLGISASFGLGRYAGLRLVARYGSALHLDRSLLIRVERWFEKRGKWLLTIGYFIPGVRHVTALIAGASELPAATFSLFAYSGAILWVGCFLSIGYTLGAKWREVAADLHRGFGVLAVAAGAAVLYILWRSRRSTTS